MIDADRKIATVLAADVVGYSRLMERDEAATLSALQARRGIFDAQVTAHGGVVFGSVGDSLMAQFPSAVHAVNCAAQIQSSIAELNASMPAEARMELRMGLHLGDVVQRDGGLLGDGVNIAARVQALAPPGGVLISASVHEQLRGKVNHVFAFAGRHRVKNISYPIVVFRLAADGRVTLRDRLRDRRGALAWTAAGVLAFAALFMWWRTAGSPAVTPSDARKLPVIAVAPVQNLTGNPELDWLGVGLANLVRDRLSQSKYLSTVSEGWWATLVIGRPEPAEVQRRAAAAGIDYVMFGELLASPNGFILTNRVSNMRDGSESAAQVFEGLQQEDVIGAAYRLTILAKQALKVPQTEQVDSYAADFAVRHPGAYEAYLAGLRFHRAWRSKEAEQSMQAALTLAPDFHMARYRLAMIRNATGSTRDAVELMEAIPDDAAIPRRERLYFDGARAFFSQDFPAATAAYQALLGEYPNEIEARQRLAEVYFHARDFDKAIAELRFLGQVEPQNEEVWNQLTAYLTIAGRLDEADAANRTHMKIAPGLAHPYSLEADILRDRGELAAAQAGYEKALAIDCNFPPAAQGHAQVLAMQGLVSQSMSEYRAILGDDRFDLEERLTAAFNLAALLRSRGQFVESSAVIEKLQAEIEAEKVRVALGLALRARNALSLGDRTTALRLAQRAVERSPAGGVPTRYLYTRGLVEVESGDRTGVAATARAIREHALPADNPDRTEEKAASHLEGLLELGVGQPEAARIHLQRAVDLGGFRYALYEIDLARALAQLGRAPDAQSLITAVGDARDAGDPRIDLEPERARAKRELERLARASGRSDDAARLARQIQTRWGVHTDDPAPALKPCQKTVQRGTGILELELPVEQPNLPADPLPSRSAANSAGDGQSHGVRSPSSSRPEGARVRIHARASLDKSV